MSFKACWREIKCLQFFDYMDADRTGCFDSAY